MDRYEKPTLEDVWRYAGPSGVRGRFLSLVSNDKSRAAGQLNDNRLGFPVFYTLLDDIIKHGLAEDLGPRGSAALYICAQKIKRLKAAASSSRPDDATLYGTLRWMLDTGLGWDGPSRGHDEYDAVMDYAVALAISEYEDKEVLPEVARLIFRRNRRGLYIHDLVWGFFQTISPEALELVAGYLNSPNPADVALAKTLLAADAFAGAEQPSRRGTNPGRGGENRRRRYLDWLQDNRPYLYLTGEHLQMTSSPKYYDCDMEAKYLDKEISPRYRASTTPLTEDEAENLRRYRVVPPDQKSLLAEYSHKLRKRDKGQWREWMRGQIADQVLAARQDTEGEAV